MKTELIVALVSGGVALVSAAGTVWSSIKSTSNARDIEILKIENAKFEDKLRKQAEISKYLDPIVRSAYDLQSRLYNILKNNLIFRYLENGNQIEKDYVVNNTTFLIGQYFCWTELARKELRFIDLEQDKDSAQLARLQDNIYSVWATDQFPAILRVFAGEQRAIGDSLIVSGNRGLECMGYGTFLKNFKLGNDPQVDALREGVAGLSANLNDATDRLTNLQNVLIDLIDILDPKKIRFPIEHRFKVR